MTDRNIEQTSDTQLQSTDASNIEPQLRSDERLAFFNLKGPQHIPYPSEATQDTAVVVQQAASRLGLDGTLHVGKQSDLRDSAADALGYSDRRETPGEDIAVIGLKEGATVSIDELEKAIEDYNQATHGAFQSDVDAIERMEIFQYDGKPYVAVKVTSESGPEHIADPSERTQDAGIVLQQVTSRLGLEGALHIGKQSNLRNAAAEALGYSNRAKSPGENIAVVGLKEGASLTIAQLEDAIADYNSDTFGAFQSEISSIERMKIFEYEGKPYVAVEVAE